MTEPQDRRLLAYCVAVMAMAAGSLALSLALSGVSSATKPTTILFWILLLAVVNLLPMSVGFSAEVTMGFPVHVTMAILFRNHPWVPMVITAIGGIDVREFRREIPVYRALFNRSQAMLSVGAAATIFSMGGTTNVGVIAAAAAAQILINWGLVAGALTLAYGRPMSETFLSLSPARVPGFVLTYGLLTAVGVATAKVSTAFAPWAVIAIIIPLLFARMGLMGARAQQELSERLRKQQEMLLQVNEQLFSEREQERKRIAADIHDTSLQLISAASYLTRNALGYLSDRRTDKAQESIEKAAGAMEDAITELRASLSDLSRSAVDRDTLNEAARRLAQQASALWGVNIRVEGEITQEPPASVVYTGSQIIQEALVNALKHAGTDSIVVRLSDPDGQVHIEVEDFGRGFVTGEQAETGHVGMRLMRERALKVGGTLELHSRPGRGTRVLVDLPGRGQA